MTPSAARPVITDASARERYEAHLDGELAGVLVYRLMRGRIALIHTEVLPSHEGRAWRPRSSASRSMTLDGVRCESSRPVHMSRHT